MKKRQTEIIADVNVYSEDLKKICWFSDNYPHTLDRQHILSGTM